MDRGRTRVGPSAGRIFPAQQDAEGRGRQPGLSAADRRSGFGGILRALGGQLLRQDGQHEAGRSVAEHHRHQQPTFAAVHLQPLQRRGGQRRLRARTVRDFHALRRRVPETEAVLRGFIYNPAGRGGFRGRVAPAHDQLRVGVGMGAHRRASQRAQGVLGCRRRGDLRHRRGRFLRRLVAVRFALGRPHVHVERFEPHADGVRLWVELLFDRQLLGHFLREQRIRQNLVQLFHQLRGRRDVSAGTGGLSGGDQLCEDLGFAWPAQRPPESVVFRERHDGVEQFPPAEESAQGDGVVRHGHPVRMATGGGFVVGAVGRRQHRDGALLGFGFGHVGLTDQLHLALCRGGLRLDQHAGRHSGQLGGRSGGRGLDIGGDLRAGVQRVGRADGDDGRGGGVHGERQRVSGADVGVAIPDRVVGI